jgi:hypothetical protein
MEKVEELYRRQLENAEQIGLFEDCIGELKE